MQGVLSDLSTNAKTKEEYITKGCQARIRGYLAKAESQLLESDKKANSADFAGIIANFKAKLKASGYNGHYFDRSHDSSGPSGRICDETGRFLCEGRYDHDNCGYSANNVDDLSSGDGVGGDCLREGIHQINPYDSPESRVVFSTWNLDHV